MTKKRDWCKGFCRTCGTGCAQYCEQIDELRAENATLKSALEGCLEYALRVEQPTGAGVANEEEAK